MRLRISRIALLLWLVSSLAWTSAPVQAAESDQADRSLVEHSGEIFFGTIDIVTAVFPVTTDAEPAMNTEYTVLISDVLKGNLRPQTMVVVRQDGGDADFADGDGPLAPGAEYLFFTYYDPALLRYVIVEPAIGNVAITSPEQRDELTAHWSAVVQQTACGYTDVLKLNGVVYAKRDWNDDKRYLEREQVGPTIDTVDRQDTTATGCRDDLVDRTASVIPAGTKVQSVDGYAPTFRVAVRLPDRHRYLYEAIWSENAKTGADLLDIHDRVTSITWGDSADCPDKAVCDIASVETKDSAVIARVVDLILDAPVGPVTFRVTEDLSNGISLLFGLKDGSTAYIYFLATRGSSQSGIQVPVEELIAALRNRAEQ
ncbi:MAG TPA: hypothetical protein VHR64_05090 [Thermomicrobiales bacterium]|nr:hypothetical protein [Thermomicrobiales bacterium]